MPEISDLQGALRAIDLGALSMVLEPRNAERRHALCRLIDLHRNAVAADYSLGDADILRRNILAMFNEILAASAALDGDPEPQRIGLIVSYARTMRGFIGRLLAG
jgi:hypothetical protein